MSSSFTKAISLILILTFVFCDFSVDVLYLQSIPVPVVKLRTASTVHANVYCLPPNEGGQTPVFDPVIGFCTLPPLDPYGKCAAPYVYSTTNKVCILTPACNGAEYWDANAKQCVAYTGRDPVPGDTTPVFPDNSCAVDLNGNGEVEQDEIFQCTQTPQGYICPQGQTECIPQYTQPTCPAGYTYNSQTQKCEATVTQGSCSSVQVPYTDYQCPTTGQIYSDLTTCNNNCIQTAQCTSSTSTYQTTPNYTNYCRGALYTSCPAGCHDNDVCNGSFRSVLNDVASRIGVTVSYSYYCCHISCDWNTCELNVYPCMRYDRPRCVQVSMSARGVYANVNGINRWLLSKDFLVVRLCDYTQIDGRAYSRGNIINLCANQPNCPSGTLVRVVSSEGIVGFYCQVTVTTYTCPLGNYSCTGSPPTCTKGQTCVTHTDYTTKWQCSLDGVQYDTQSQCTTNCHSACPAGGTYNPSTGKCEATATCSTGTLQSQGCFTGYGCPLGSYQCQQVGSQWMCSPYQCITQSQIQDEGDIIAAGLEDDGERDANGNCLGTLYIFNGKGMRCRKSGVQTGFHNCCNESRGRLYDSTGSTGFGSVTDAIKAVAAVYQAVKVGYWASKIAAGEYTIQGYYLMKGSEIITHFSPNDPAFKALQGIERGMNPDVAVSTATKSYVENLGTDVAIGIAQLAVSQVIKDPVLSSAVNFVLACISGNPVNIAFSVINLAMSLFMQRCDSQDIETSTFNDSRYCHEVGEYCVKKWALVGCVQKAKSYCCFNSKLARIIHEQGRLQLPDRFGPNGGWTGVPNDPNFSVKKPNCRGFLPEEFQALDFNKIDLSEYVEDIQRNVRTNLQQNLQQQFNQTMQDLTGH